MSEKDFRTLHCELRQQWIDALEDRTCVELKSLEYLKLEILVPPIAAEKTFRN